MGNILSPKADFRAALESRVDAAINTAINTNANLNVSPHLRAQLIRDIQLVVKTEINNALTLNVNLKNDMNNFFGGAVVMFTMMYLYSLQQFIHLAEVLHVDAIMLLLIIFAFLFGIVCVVGPIGWALIRQYIYVSTHPFSVTPNPAHDSNPNPNPNPNLNPNLNPAPAPNPNPQLASSNVPLAASVPRTWAYIATNGNRSIFKQLDNTGASTWTETFVEGTIGYFKTEAQNVCAHLGDKTIKGTLVRRATSATANGHGTEYFIFPNINSPHRLFIMKTSVDGEWFNLGDAIDMKT